MNSIRQTVSKGLAGEPLSGAEVLRLLGGVRGIAESFAPATVFLVIFAITQNVLISAIAPAIAAVIALLLRLIQKVSITPALAGLLGVVVCSLTTLLTGNPEDYFLPGLVVNICWFIGLLLSIIVRWPLLGFVIGIARGSLTDWRTNQRLRGAAYLASYVWLAMFALRLAVQVPLFIADEVTALGIARVTMGLPLYALVILFTWMIVRGLPPLKPSDEPKIQSQNDQPS